MRLASNKSPKPAAPAALRCQPNRSGLATFAQCHYVKRISEPDINEAASVPTICAAIQGMGNGAKPLQQRSVEAMMRKTQHAGGGELSRVSAKTKLLICNDVRPLTWTGIIPRHDDGKLTGNKKQL